MGMRIIIAAILVLGLGLVASPAKADRIINVPGGVYLDTRPAAQTPGGEFTIEYYDNAPGIPNDDPFPGLFGKAADVTNLTPGHPNSFESFCLEIAEPIAVNQLYYFQ